MYAVNKLPVLDMIASTEECCPKIDPKEWNEKIFVFKDKLFAKVKTRNFFYIPLNMSSAMRKAKELIHGAYADANEYLMLSDDVSPWHSDHYIAISTPVYGLETVEMSGTFMTKTFEGPYREVARWRNQLIDFVKKAGKKPLKTYFFYTTCPKCARTYKKNYVIGFEQVNSDTERQE